MVIDSKKAAVGGMWGWIEMGIERKGIISLKKKKLNK